jgi:hypothetical protein
MESPFDVGIKPHTAFGLLTEYVLSTIQLPEGLTVQPLGIVLKDSLTRTVCCACEKIARHPKQIKNKNFFMLLFFKIIITIYSFNENYILKIYFKSICKYNIFLNILSLLSDKNLKIVKFNFNALNVNCDIFVFLIL